MTVRRYPVLPSLAVIATVGVSACGRQRQPPAPVPVPVQADRLSYAIPADSARARSFLVDSVSGWVATLLFTETAACASDPPEISCLEASPEQHAMLMRRVRPALDSLPLTIDTTPATARAQIGRRIPRAEPQRVLADARRLHHCDDWGDAEVVPDSFAAGPCTAFRFEGLYWVLSARAAPLAPVTAADSTAASDAGERSRTWQRLEIFLAKPGSSEGIQP